MHLIFGGNYTAFQTFDVNETFAQIRIFTPCRKPHVAVFRQFHRQAHFTPAARRCGRKHNARSIIFPHRGIDPLRRFLIEFDHGTRNTVLRGLYLHRKNDRITRLCSFHGHTRGFSAEPGSAVRIIMYFIFVRVAPFCVYRQRVCGHCHNIYTYTGALFERCARVPAFENCVRFFRFIIRVEIRKRHTFCDLCIRYVTPAVFFKDHGKALYHFHVFHVQYERRTCVRHIDPAEIYASVRRNFCLESHFAPARY